MWTRKELKDKAKVSFKANYWKSVLVALIAVIITVGVGPASSSVSNPSPSSLETPSYYDPDNVGVEVRDGRVVIDIDDHDGGKVHIDVDDDSGRLAEVVRDLAEEEFPSHGGAWFGPGMVVFGISAFLIALIAIAVAVAAYVFIFSPLEVGAARFFVRNLNQRAEVKELAYGYDLNYKEVVKTIFLRSLFVFLWSLLLIIPGIYKAYEYRMIPYLLAEDPTMTKERAFSESKRMMDGQKWQAFVLDLSFLGWGILSALTLGILGIFYVAPYQNQTNAALYEKLRYGLPEAPVAQAAPTQPFPTPPVGSGPAAGAPVGATPAGMAPVGAAPVAVAPIAVAPAAVAPAETASAAIAPIANVSGETAPMETAPAETAPAETTPLETAPVETVPVIAPASQPPVVPFAAVGYEPSNIPEESEEPAQATELSSTPEESEESAQPADPSAAPGEAQAPADPSAAPEETQVLAQPAEPSNTLEEPQASELDSASSTTDAAGNDPENSADDSPNA